MGAVNNNKPTKPNCPKLKYDDEMELYVMEMKLHNARMDSLNNVDMKGVFREQLRMLMSETKPIKPVSPQRKAKASGVYRLPDALVSNIMKIKGLNRVTNDSSRILFEVSLSKFELKEEKKDKNGEKQLICHYREIAGYKVYDENNVLIDEGMAPRTDEWREKKIIPSSKALIVEEKKHWKNL